MNILGLFKKKGSKKLKGRGTLRRIEEEGVDLRWLKGHIAYYCFSKEE